MVSLPSSSVLSGRNFAETGFNEVENKVLLSELLCKDNWMQTLWVLLQFF